MVRGEQTEQKGCRRMVIGTRGKLVNCVRQGEGPADAGADAGA